ncbi:Insulin-like growth factor binding protein, N-terminal [Pseudocohnilembus persalinus]|uniref:Insulin-like growth factor binding protein, N-terminal n=1 Tax=Pseudocohnilembus persalinus TaxID=266149 RepID=A0A0V0QQC6_PSEPJ|nr:Insulin-like growth factor binding protein, N-terminal [Pseudocohnilembus persalinus]|eukprot:KRX04459.1 Insulin-like growth factor binding protein, N-terminal [Pseudocohnilembus persalinus]
MIGIIYDSNKIYLQQQCSYNCATCQNWDENCDTCASTLNTVGSTTTDFQPNGNVRNSNNCKCEQDINLCKLAADGESQSAYEYKYVEMYTQNCLHIDYLVEDSCKMSYVGNQLFQFTWNHFKEWSNQLKIQPTTSDYRLNITSGVCTQHTCLDQGFYESGSQCLKCPNQCDSCYQDGEEIQCASCSCFYAEQNREDKPKKNCPCLYNFYDDGIQPYCLPCHKNCAGCEFEEQSCLACIEPSPKRELPSCECSSGYYEDINIQCQLCQFPCMTCSSIDTCLTCQAEQNGQMLRIPPSCACNSGFEEIYDEIQGIYMCQKIVVQKNMDQQEIPQNNDETMEQITPKQQAYKTQKEEEQNSTAKGVAATSEMAGTAVIAAIIPLTFAGNIGVLVNVVDFTQISILFLTLDVMQKGYVTALLKSFKQFSLPYIPVFFEFFVDLKKYNEQYDQNLPEKFQVYEYNAFFLQNIGQSVFLISCVMLCYLTYPIYFYVLMKRYNKSRRQEYKEKFSLIWDGLNIKTDKQLTFNLMYYFRKIYFVAIITALYGQVKLQLILFTISNLFLIIYALKVNPFPGKIGIGMHITIECTFIVYQVVTFVSCDELLCTNSGWDLVSLILIVMLLCIGILVAETIPKIFQFFRFKYFKLHDIYERRNAIKNKEESLIQVQKAQIQLKKKQKKIYPQFQQNQMLDEDSQGEEGTSNTKSKRDMPKDTNLFSQDYSQSQQDMLCTNQFTRRSQGFTSTIIQSEKSLFSSKFSSAINSADQSQQEINNISPQINAQKIPQNKDIKYENIINNQMIDQNELYQNKQIKTFMLNANENNFDIQKKRSKVSFSTQDTKNEKDQDSNQEEISYQNSPNIQSFSDKKCKSKFFNDFKLNQEFDEDSQDQQKPDGVQQQLQDGDSKLKKIRAIYGIQNGNQKIKKQKSLSTNIKKNTFQQQNKYKFKINAPEMKKSFYNQYKKNFELNNSTVYSTIQQDNYKNSQRNQENKLLRQGSFENQKKDLIKNKFQEKNCFDKQNQCLNSPNLKGDNQILQISQEYKIKNNNFI